MGLLTKPAAYTASTVSPAALNATQDGIFDWAGTVVNGQGSISDVNIAVAAAVNKTKIADTAVVCGNTVNAGTQTITRPTSVSGSGLFLETSGAGWSPDLTAGNIQTAALVGASQAVALAAGKSVLKLTSGAAASLSTITGGIEGQKLTVVLADANTTVNHTATNTVNTIHLNRKAAVAGDAGMVIMQLTFSAALTGTGQWWEI